MPVISACGIWAGYRVGACSVGGISHPRSKADSVGRQTADVTGDKVRCQDIGQRLRRLAEIRQRSGRDSGRDPAGIRQRSGRSGERQGGVSTASDRPCSARPSAHVESAARPLRVALLSYRSKPHCGGQGIYLRHVSRELTALGHQVEVFSGQPYPELEPGPLLRTLPSLDLYRDDNPFRTPRPSDYRDWIDALEVAAMWTGAFPEPLTFSLRALRALRGRRGDFDIVHDNQVLAYGMLGITRLGLPLVTSIHHPISVDRRIGLAPARGPSPPSKRRWARVCR